MEAVIQIGSHQYPVRPGQTIEVEKLDGPVGSEVRFTDLKYISDEKKVLIGAESKGTVVGTITAQEKGKKITVFKKIRRKGFHRTQGHRQAYTKVEITKIEV